MMNSPISVIFKVQNLPSHLDFTYIYEGVTFSIMKFARLGSKEFHYLGLVCIGMYKPQKVFCFQKHLYNSQQNGPKNFVFVQNWNFL